MEKKPQADSERKSPVSKSPLPEGEEKALDGKVGDINGAPKDQTLDSKDLESYQDNKSNIKESEKPLENIQHIDKKDIVGDNSLVTDDKLSQSIISVDIQKSLPCDTKESVPHGTKQDNKQEAATVPPEVLASVVTNAVVNEAALTVSETNGVAVNGSKITKDSSKVDAVVEQELCKISDSKSVKTDAKLLVTSNGDTKPMPNGDIDHSPVRDASSQETAKLDKNDSKKETVAPLKDETIPSGEQIKKDTDHSEKPTDTKDTDLQSKPEEKVEKIDIGSRNGVPGIITVESITKRETINNQNETEKVEDTSKDLESTEKPKSVDNTDKVKTSIKESEEKSPKHKDETATIPDSKSAVVEDNLTDSAKLQKASYKSTDSSKITTVSESKVTTAEEKAPVITELPISGATSDTSDKTNAKPGDPVTEKESAEKDLKLPSEKEETKLSADASTKSDVKAEKESSDSKKKETISPSPIAEIKSDSDVPTKSEVKEEKESAVSKQKDITTPSTTAEIKSSDAPPKSDIKEETKSKDSKGTEAESSVTPAEIKSTSDSAAKPDVKEEPKQKEDIALKKETEQKEVKIDVDKSKEVSKPEVTETQKIVPEKITDAVDKDKKEDSKTQNESSKLPGDVGVSKIEDVKSNLDKESSKVVEVTDLKKDETDKSVVKESVTNAKDSQKEPLDLTKGKEDKDKAVINDIPCEETYDMTAMMTSQILTPADLGIEESAVEDEKIESKDTSIDESIISATVVNGKTCDVAVGLDEKKMARVAAPDGGEEEVDGQQESAEIEVPEDTTVANGNNVGDSLISNGAGSGAPSSAASDKSVPSKPTSASSQKEEVKKEEEKPASAVSRTSIPEPIVYEPPERRKSATSVSGDIKKDSGADKSQLDEKESEKKDKTKTEEGDSEKKTPGPTPEHQKIKESDKDDNKLKEESEVKDTVLKGSVSEKEVAEEKDITDKPPKEKETIIDATIPAETTESLKDEKSVSEKSEEIKTESKTGDIASVQKETDTQTQASTEAEEKAPEPTKSEPSAAEEKATKEEAPVKEMVKDLTEDSKVEEPVTEKEKGEKDSVEKEEVDEVVSKSAEISDEKEKELKEDVKEPEKADQQDIKSTEKAEEPSAEKVEESSAEKAEKPSGEKTEEPSGETAEEASGKEETVSVEKVSGVPSETPEPIDKPTEETSKSPEPVSQPPEKKETSPEPTKEPEISSEAPEPTSEQSESQKDSNADVKEDETKDTITELTQEKQKEESTEEVTQAEDAKEAVEEAIEAEDGKVAADVKEVTEEPKTLVEESKEKETAKADEKDEDDTEKETTPEKETDADYQLDDLKAEEVLDNKAQEEQAEAEGAKDESESKSEEKGEEESKEDEEKEKVDEEAAQAAEPKDEDKTEPEEKEKAEEDVESKEAEEKRDIGKEEAEEKSETLPKSPTKRSGSPTKGRRGISPTASPPKVLRAPTSPTKPQKSSSPKKKNGMLSPIKTPKTPGSDGRKLPPIKAPVGLAPNPNLKNIRSKIGSFDNIKYKPGGGDKKVISSKKLEWKAAPKVGSLDHTYKKHGKGSKGESKEGKLIDGQSPLPSGDEGDAEGTASGIAETLIKPDGAASTEMPSAITAES